MLSRIENTRHIGNVTLKSLRDYILDNAITEEDTIVLNQINFDEIALEHRRIYNEGIVYPYFILRVLIKEDEDNSVPFGRIKLILKDENRFYEDYAPQPLEQGPNSSHEFDTVYRCGYCGDMVEFNGNKLDDNERAFRISVLEKFPRTVTTKQTSGYCCRNK
jgi:hypothetical protein